jgi:hypothetical protein
MQVTRVIIPSLPLSFGFEIELIIKPADLKYACKDQKMVWKVTKIFISLVILVNLLNIFFFELVFV